MLQKRHIYSENEIIKIFKETNLKENSPNNENSTHC